MSAVEDAVAALRAGRPVVLPFDTVYGLAADPRTREPVERLYRLKGRDQTQPSALVAADVDVLLGLVPELTGRSATIARALLPGALTLIFPNPARRFGWIAGANANAIGIRVPDLSGPGAEVLAQVGAVVATSANRPGERDPATLQNVPDEIRAGAGAAVDGGRLPGEPSTVVDLTDMEPRVIREGAVGSEEVLRRLGSAVRSS
jgi:L-threonylcarbamoyladenylate synthase